MMAPFLTGLTSGDVITSTLHIIKGEQTCAYIITYRVGLNITQLGSFVHLNCIVRLHSMCLNVTYYHLLSQKR